MKKGMPVSIRLSVLLTLVLAGCADAAEVKLTPSDGAVWDCFGYSVSISGEYAIVGAHYDNDKGNNSGSAYIFKRDGTGWTEQAKVTASDGAARDCFGYSVAISGDYAVVGAYLDDDDGSGSGSAHIFKRDGTTWSQQTKITASDGVAKDYFGCSVAISGDYVIVGACYDGGNVGNSGSAYIFKRNNSSWTEQVKVTASDGAAYDEFGRSIAISGDCAIVGAYYDDDNGSNSGSAYIFKRDNSSWSEQAKIIANDGAVDDHFGCSVAISGDYAIVGVHCDDDNGNESGSAYIYDILTPEPPTTGDLNGDDRLTSADAVIALWMAAGSCEPTDAADVSSDGVVNSLDALMILQTAAGLITL